MPGDLSKIRQSQADKLNVIQLSNGVELLIKKIPSPKMIDILDQANAERPRPPVHFIERLGREEENPDDPVYLEALNGYNIRRGKILMDTFLMYGTQLYSSPAGIPSIDHPEEWMDGMSELGMSSPKGKRGIYLEWLKTIALAEEEDFTKVMNAVGQKAGVREADVQSASSTFRPDAGREAARTDQTPS